MAKQYLRLYLTAIVFSAILALQALASTDPLDGNFFINPFSQVFSVETACCVRELFSFLLLLLLFAVTALQDLYRALNNPSQLNRWKSDGGDPCGESWSGVSCSGSSVLYLKLNGLDLIGHLGGQLHNLHNLKHLDVSSNNIHGEIPNDLPPDATHINMASNKLSQNIPYSMSTLKHLRHLNLSHNSLSGPIGNVFTGLQYLKELDLSYNNFTGDLPSSFGSLTNLTRLFLQSNKFSGSVIYLANLPLIDLNIVDNDFSGVIPKEFQSIPNLLFWGNKFRVDPNSPPWGFPLDSLPFENNITAPPTTESSAIEKHPSIEAKRHSNKGLGPGGIAFICGVALVATFAALFVVIRINRARAQRLKRLDSSNSRLRHSERHSVPMTTDREFSCTALEESPQPFTVSSPFFLGQRPTPPVSAIRTEKTGRRKSFSKKCKLPAKVYSVAELQLATNSFSEENLLGEGSLGSVYKAEFPDGQIFAVKNINMVSLSFHEEEQFMDVIRTSSQLRHPNIVSLIGFCAEHGQHILVYEYVRNLSLDDALHNEEYKPLSWSIRLHIALGIARALGYLHSIFSPPVSHCNIKAANVLLDEELMPRVCDCGLAILRPLTSNIVKYKASEIAPENGEPGSDNTKTDVYAFGVLLLELLSGRKAVDNSSRGRQEQQSFVKWASSRLHDRDWLEQMIDPGIKGTIPPKALSQFADIVSMCIQPVEEFRPPMSEIVESLTSLLAKLGMTKSSVADVTEADPFERSFRSTHTRFLGSPAMSYLSV
ncbi:hypothetical protein EZV62_015530 [Acer yangbiense]|uniref:Protein kinase domain-containing protein n=1 Tax=Acer yangbiense TaxID=1000413 RepID=A0A5C7HL34_9ROSI|nr:hypothetical protein EZV62_015530 [Acer yangbiense]